MIHKPKCELYDENTIRNSIESHLQWKNHFQKNPLPFRIYANFGADNEIEDGKDVGNKTTNFYKQNPMMNAYNV